MSQIHTTNPNRYIGALVLAGFGLFLLITFSRIAFAHALLPAIAIATAGLLLAGFACYRFLQCRAQSTYNPSVESRRRSRRQLGLVITIEAVLIFGLSRWLVQSGHSERVGDMLLLIVGLHFLPLSRILKYKPYLFTGFTLILLAAVNPVLLPASVPSPLPLAGSGIVLWITALLILS